MLTDFYIVIFFIYLCNKQKGNIMAIKLYPLGIQTFERIRKEDRLYIDKTEYIYRMTHSDSVYYFLSRPRRFGKSLLVTTQKATSRERRICSRNLLLKSLRKNGRNIPCCTST